MNTRKASGEIFGSAVGSLLGGAFGKNLGPWVIAGAVLMTGTGVLAAFGALAAKPERLAERAGLRRRASRSVTALPTRPLGPAR